MPRPVTLLLACTALFAAAPARAFDRDPAPADTAAPEPPSLSAASAENEPKPHAAEPVDPPRRWYGGQILPIDLAAVFLGLSAIAVKSDLDRPPSTIMLGGALTVFVLGGPVVHLLHDHLDRAAGDLLLRVGAPVFCGFLGAVIAPQPGASNTEFGPRHNLGNQILGAEIGFSVGLAAAVILDATLLAYEPVEPRGATWLAPSLTFVGRAPAFGLTGTF